ncbi:MAG TPA: glycerol-3-phosphate acyltransferase [Miltoncostaeaceae bacterium]|nr:glycerol-3-phosphate acyltransferase [Miltoncostaeaceae bacterium]
MTLAVVIVTAYLLGSVPMSYIVVYRMTGRDIRTLGDGNPGTMNVWHSVGLRAALIVAAGDVGKGMAAVGIAHIAGLGDGSAIIAGLMAVAGHDFSIFLRLHGGNGTAAAIGALFALVPQAAIPAAAVAVGLYLAVGSKRFAGLIGLLLVPLLTYRLEYPDVLLVGVLLLLTVTALKIVAFEGFTPARSRLDR